MSITSENFKVSGDAIFYALILILCVLIWCSNKISYRLGVMDEKIGWLEDQHLKEGEKDAM